MTPVGRGAGFAALALALVLGTGCGQMGPLTLPEEDRPAEAEPGDEQDE